MDNKHLTPGQIVAELDKYIVGQHEAKRNVAIALRNRWRRMSVTSEIRNEIIPNNILMIIRHLQQLQNLLMKALKN